MKRLAVTALVVAALLAAATRAAAQTSSSSGVLFAFSGVPGAKLVSTTNIPAQVSGELTVSFHGDSGTECATHGLCGYAGTVIVRPGSSAVSVFKERRAGRTGYGATLALGVGPEQLTTYSVVARAVGGSRAGLCADAQHSFTALSFTPARGAFRISLLRPGGALLATRCAGPLDGDVANVAPTAVIPVRSLLRGEQQLSLAGQATFAQDGLAGSISSTLVLGLGRARTFSSAPQPPHFPRGIKTQRVREVTERLTLVRGSGTVVELVSGSTDPGVCELLDSCRLHGTVTLSPDPSPVNGELIATGPASLPYRDFLAALGRGTAGSTHRIHVIGNLAWTDRGSAFANLDQSGTCSDDASLGSGYLELGVTGQVLRADYAAVTTPRTRCPGPWLMDGQVLASGRLARGELRHRMFTFRLDSVRSLDDDGYLATLRGDLSLTLRTSARLTQHFTVQPTG